MPDDVNLCLAAIKKAKERVSTPNGGFAKDNAGETAYSQMWVPSRAHHATKTRLHSLEGVGDVFSRRASCVMEQDEQVESQHLVLPSLCALWVEDYTLTSHDSSCT